MTRITITLSKQEAEALTKSAAKAMRHPRDHARYILNHALFETKRQPTGIKEGQRAPEGIEYALAE